MILSFYIVLMEMIIVPKTLCIWPPPYEIKLDDGETFVISEFLDTDNIITDEDEMIKPSVLKPEIKGANKFRRIHQLVRRRNKKDLKKIKYFSKIKQIKEHNFDLDEPVPWEGGFADKNGNFLHPENEKVYYLNEMAKSLIDSKINDQIGDDKEKRDEDKQSTDKIENYDYNNFKAEYAKQIKTAERQNDTFNSTDTKEEPSAKSALARIVNFSEPKNCSAEEITGIGLNALKCLVTDLKSAKKNKSALKLTAIIMKIVLIWFCVYAIIAIPCWCQKGWCCCCCCCKICRPREVLDEAKQFYMNNPVGVFHDEKGNKLEYQPTNYEIYAQRRLEKALFNL